MPDKPLTPEQLKANRDAVIHIAKWLRFRQRSQKWLADQMGASEPTISKWLSGGQGMSVAQFHQIARLLDAEPQELMMPPARRDVSGPFGELVEATAKLSPDELLLLVATAKALAAKKAP